MNAAKQEKIEWQGTVLAIQPRAKVWRYKVDNRTHTTYGYNLFFDGIVNGKSGRFSVAPSEKQQKEQSFRIGDEIGGTAWTKQNEISEYADFYRTSGLRVLKRAILNKIVSPPYLLAPPDMKTYEWRGARMLSISCYKGKCFQCVWANMATVTIEYDFGVKRKYRFESFCYGPKSCKFYRMGRPRAVPYKNDGSSYDTGGLDECCTEKRGMDE